jgi:hypothetical protein
MGSDMSRIAAIALVAALAVCAGSGAAFAQAGSAVGLIFHSSIVSYCEGRELTQQEAQGTAIGLSSMWQTMRDCQANRAKREAAAAAAAAKKK